MYGMVPKWAKDTSMAKYTYNARSETVMDKQSFKRTWYNNQFALIPVQTIFEPKYIDGKAHRYDIHREDNEPFTVAALYEIIEIGEQIVRSMTMLTILLCHSFTNLRMKTAQLWWLSLSIARIGSIWRMRARINYYYWWVLGMWQNIVQSQKTA